MILHVLIATVTKDGYSTQIGIIIAYSIIQFLDSADGWVSVPLFNPGMYNLLDFRNGEDTLLGGVSLPAGKVSRIRLILGDNNQIEMGDGSTVDLKTPSAQQSGLKLNVDADLKPGIPY